MGYVNNQTKAKWGNQFSDRDNSFDDDTDCYRLIEFATRDESFAEYLSKYVPKTKLRWAPKHYGAYGVDVSLVDENNESVANFDVERWSKWENDWPAYYKYISFLERKEKFMDKGVPFFMCYFSNDRDRLLVIEETEIKKYRTVDKYFGNHGCTDRIKQVAFKEGHVFGDYTSKESSLFQTS